MGLGTPRPADAEDSLTALLSRRDKVCSSQAPLVAPRPELFRPEQSVTTPLPGVISDAGSAAEGIQPVEPTDTTPKTSEQAPSTTTSRLLEAKRRAQKRRP